VTAPPSIAEIGKTLGGRLPQPGQAIGLLGGSFNPAHSGHLEISERALARLGLDEVWWLVSPQNPLKPSEGMAAQDERVAHARAVVGERRGIRITTLEAALGTRYTAETLALLNRRFPRVRFVWLMGADNLVQIDRWRNWQEIFNRAAVAVLDRPTYSRRALASKAARRFARDRIPERRARSLVKQALPAWVFLHGPLNSLSATALRKER
jgi:nicotinate-nucleotide adenylyltransferase